MCEITRGPFLSISLLLTAFCGTGLSQNGCAQFPGYNVPLSDMHGLGGTNNAATTLNDCQLSCALDDTCQSFDWNPNNNNGAGYLCWTYPLNAANTYYVLPATGITHYVKNTTCSPFIGTTTITSIPSTIPSTIPSIPSTRRVVTTSSADTTVSTNILLQSFYTSLVNSTTLPQVNADLNTTALIVGVVLGFFLIVSIVIIIIAFGIIYRLRLQKI